MESHLFRTQTQGNTCGGSSPPLSAKERWKIKDDKISQMRKSGQEIWRWIWKDSRGYDRKNNLEHKLTIDDIKKLSSETCRYCGESSLRMTLDRIDNTIGHTLLNVVPACIRCNYMRKDMPYDAWLVIVPAVRMAREQGLFGSWTGRVR